MKKKPVKEVKMHKFLVCLYKYQDFAQSQKNFARSHDRETVTFRNSDWIITITPYVELGTPRAMGHSRCSAATEGKVLTERQIEKKE